MAGSIPKKEAYEIIERCYAIKITTDEAKLEEIKKFEIKNSDIFLIGNAKSGTTWAQEMIWLIANDLNFEKAKVFIDERFPLLEFASYKVEKQFQEAMDCHDDSLEFIKNMKDPRFIKTHFPPEKLPEQILSKEKTPKIIYIARNPKDSCLSLFYYQKMLDFFRGTLEETAKLFMSDFSPIQYYWQSVLYFWNHRHDDNILFIRYEEMKNNLSEVMHKVADFLKKPLSKEQEVQLIKWLDFESMKNNPAVNHETLFKKSGFMRVGKIGEHKKEMSAKLLSRFDIWIKESLKDSDYEI